MFLPKIWRHPSKIYNPHKSTDHSNVRDIPVFQYKEPGIPPRLQRAENPIRQLIKHVEPMWAYAIGCLTSAEHAWLTDKVKKGSYQVLNRVEFRVGLIFIRIRSLVNTLSGVCVKRKFTIDKMRCFCIAKASEDLR